MGGYRTKLAPMSQVLNLETERLNLRNLNESDAPFILGLLNEPSFIRFIGDKGVRTLDDAREYLLNGPIASYDTNGFGLYLVTLKSTGESMGMCGLIKRDSLPDPDIGFAFVPGFWNQGFAHEAASAVMIYAKDVLKLPRILAITDKDNDASGRLLEKIGLRFDRIINMPGNQKETKLFVPSDAQ